MKPKPSGARVREPIQVYMTSEERRLLDRLAKAHRLSRAEVLRRGLRSFARESAGEAREVSDSPMLRFLEAMRGADWPEDVGRDHDRHLEEAYLDDHRPAE